jgi:predicted metal-dependent enzyme (double-stranded beta helix superfamily)
MQIPKEYIENLIKDARDIINQVDDDGIVLDKIPPLLAKIIDLESLIK